eukprot:118466-Pyramimonas_sp.AAC.1
MYCGAVPPKLINHALAFDVLTIYLGIALTPERPARSTWPSGPARQTRQAGVAACAAAPDPPPANVSRVP